MEQAQKKHEYHDGDVLLGSLSSSSTSSCVSGISSGSSLESDSFEEVSSPAVSSSSSSSSLTDVQLGVVDDPLNDMSSLFQQLPIKRGLSKFYEGKSQSFRSLSNVRSLEDLAKAEKPHKKRLKSWKSCGGGLSERSYRGICKRGIIGGTRASCSSLSARKGRTSFMGSRPPIPTHRPTNTNTKAIPNRTVLFA